MLNIISNTFPMEKRVFAMFCWQERGMKRQRPEVRGHWPLRETQSKSQTQSWDTHCQRATPTVAQGKSMPSPLVLFFFPAEVMDSEPPSDCQWSCPVFRVGFSLSGWWWPVSDLVWPRVWGPWGIFLVFPCTAVYPFLLGYVNSLISFKNKKQNEKEKNIT